MEIGANKILPKVNFSPSSSNNLLTEKCHLSVEVGLNNLSFCLFDTLSFTYVLLKEFEFNANGISKSCKIIKDIIASESLLQKEFYSSSLALNHFPSTLVPIPFYKEEKNKEILKFNHEVYEEILSDKMQQMEAINIYSIPRELLTLIHEYFPNTQIKCNSSILIEQLLLQNKSNEEKVYTLVKNNILEICILKQDRLQLHNSFLISTKEDILYYLLFALEQMGMSGEKIELILIDDILKSDEKYNLLYEYVRDISFVNRSEKLNFSKELDSIKSHQYFCLFSQLLCV
ncbi:MAG: DUF3822 family protein [Flavobacteriales bacterium]|nr:DUF3822 family protein [Flavobacteriales bacterium]